MDFSAIKDLHIGATPVQSAWLNGHKVWQSTTLDNSLVDAWIFSGHTNAEAPTSILGEKGTALRCYNFAWNEEGSGFKDGALWFDGVDDVLIGDSLPILTQYTVIAKRELIFFPRYSTFSSKYRFEDSTGNGAFLFECNNSPNDITYPITIQNFGAFADISNVPSLYSYLSYDGMNVFYNGFLKYQSTRYYEDGEYLSIGASRSNFQCECKTYWYALYNQSLTDGQIQNELQKLEELYNRRLNQ